MIDSERPVTRAELTAVVAEAVQQMLVAMNTMGADLERRLRAELGADMKRHYDALREYFTDLFRALNDENRARDDRIAQQEQGLADHVSDDTVHKRPRRARR